MVIERGSVVLHKITGRNKYCGPAAITAVLGIPTHQSSALIRQISGKNSVMGTHFYHLTEVFDFLGVEHEIIHLGKDRPTFFQFLKTYDGALTILGVTGHYITLEGDQWIDNVVKKPQHVELYQKKKRVQFIIRIKKIPDDLKTGLALPQRKVFTGDKGSLVDLIKHYGTKELISLYEDRFDSMISERDMVEAHSLKEIRRYAFDDLVNLYQIFGEDLRAWKTINLLAHKWKSK